MSAIRTSVTHPLRVDFLPADVLPLPGRLGMTFAPGKQGAGIGGSWKRDLEADLARIHDVHGASVLVSLIEDVELASLRIPRLFERVQARGLTLERLAIRDGSVPADAQAFLALVARLVGHLTDGKNVVVHCKGGLGRTGTLVAACLISATGMHANDAIAATRAARAGAVETGAQENFLRALVVARVAATPCGKPPDASPRFGWESVAYTINGYELWGSLERCADVARRVNRSFRTGDRSVELTIDELRTALFFTARADRHSGQECDGVVEGRIVDAIVERMGSAWMQAEVDRDGRPASPPRFVERNAMPFLGAAFGDALGAGVEGGKALARAIAEAPDEVGRRFWPYSPFNFKPGEVTDDTQMTLMAILALRGERPNVSTVVGRAKLAERVGAAYRAWFQSGPPDIGNATRDALVRPSTAGGWLSWGGGDSAGNGSLMRATAPYTAGYRGDQLLAAAVVDSALTHPDPRCIASCLWYSATLDAAAIADDPTLLPDAMRRGLEAMNATDVEPLLASLAAAAPAAWATFLARWSDARAAVARTVEAALVGEHIDCITSSWSKWPTGFVIDSLGQAAWAALQGTTADEPLRLAVLHGGRDADTIGAIAGGLVGARFGERALEHWSPGLLSQVRVGHALPGLEPGLILDLVRAAGG